MISLLGQQFTIIVEMKRLTLYKACLDVKTSSSLNFLYFLEPVYLCLITFKQYHGVSLTFAGVLKPSKQPSEYLFHATGVPQRLGVCQIQQEPSLE